MSVIKDYDGMSYMEILNFYRNLHHSDSSAEESYILANAINDLFNDLKKTKWEKENDCV